jgi:hypothetical protein
MNDELEKSVPIPVEETPQAQNIQQNPKATETPNPPSIPPAEERPRENANTTDNQKNLTKWELFERVVKVVECLAFIGAVVSAFFIGVQWSEMANATKVATDQLKAMQGQADIMKGQLDEMKRTRSLDERAWVIPTQPCVVISPIGDSGSMSVKIQYKNTGKTPSIKTTCIICGTTNFNDIIIGKNEGFPTNSKNFGMLSPNETMNSLLGDINKETVQFIKSGNLYYFYGTIYYEDIFTNPHWTKFAYISGTNLDETFPIAIHNSCDDVETNKSN